MKAFKKYLITLLAGFGAAALIAWSKDLFAQTTAVAVYHILCDSFFVVGVVITSIGLLILSTNEGTFDMLVYGMKAFVDIFRKESVRKYDNFYDYRMSREDKKLPFGFLLICGVFFLAVSMVMLYCYNQCQ